MIWVVVPAAGSGSRFDPRSAKQYCSVAGRPLLEHCLWRLAQHPLIIGVVVALHPDDRQFASLQLPATLSVCQVIGGEQRADSVLAALQALPAEVADKDSVLVHDAARPCLSVELLSRLLDCRADPHGALLALPSPDTLKVAQAEADGWRAQATVDRSLHWRAQTPQLFPRAALTAALRAAQTAGLPITDESMAMERAGYRPKLVIGNESNRKLTVPEDLAPIEAWLVANPLAIGFGHGSQTESGK